MAKVDIIRGFLASNRQELPATDEGVRKYIDQISRELNFRLTPKEKQDLVAEFVSTEKKAKNDPKRDEAAELLSGKE